MVNLRRLLHAVKPQAGLQLGEDAPAAHELARHGRHHLYSAEGDTRIRVREAARRVGLLDDAVIPQQLRLAQRAVPPRPDRT